MSSVVGVKYATDLADDMKPVVKQRSVSGVATTLTDDQCAVITMLQRAQGGDAVAAHQFMRFQMEMHATALAANAGGPVPDEATATHHALACAQTGKGCRAVMEF